MAANCREPEREGEGEVAHHAGPPGARREDLPVGGESQHARLKGRFDRCKLVVVQGVVVQGNPLGVEIDVSTSVSVLETSGRFQEFPRRVLSMPLIDDLGALRMFFRHFWRDADFPHIHSEAICRGAVAG